MHGNPLRQALSHQAARRVLALARDDHEQNDACRVDVDDENSSAADGLSASARSERQQQQQQQHSATAILLASRIDQGEFNDEADGGILWTQLLNHVARTDAGRRSLLMLPLPYAATRGRGTICPPVRLLVFMLPIAALLPYYTAVFATSYVTVGAVLETQNMWAVASSRGGLVCRLKAPARDRRWCHLRVAVVQVRAVSTGTLIALSGVGFPTSVQYDVATMWQNLVDVQV